MNFTSHQQQGGKSKKRGQSRSAKVLTAFLLICALMFPSGRNPAQVFAQTPSGDNNIFLPTISYNKPFVPPALIHIPYLTELDIIRSDQYSQMAVFWFGYVSLLENYNHVRMGYNQQELTIEVNTYDRDIWFDEDSPSPEEISNWDGVSIYFQIPPVGQYPSRLLRFDAQLSDQFVTDRKPYQAVYERTSGSWTKINMAFVTFATHWSEGPNGPIADKGSIINLEIPFASLGYSGKPADMSEWKMGMRIYDQNTGSGNPTIQHVWPSNFSETDTGTFAQVTFGYPKRTMRTLPVAGTTTIKEGGSVIVPDGSVGGYSTCGGSYDYWTEWGNVIYNNEPENQTVVVQNQRDVSDFPCFSRYYITFPLRYIPTGKVILSAKLTLRQFGNSDPSGAYHSYIHLFRAKEIWSESTLSWNSSPQVQENYQGIWVDPLLTYPGYPGIARTWDVTQALMDSLKSETPWEMRLILQSADWAMHSGKYFWSSETAAGGTETPPTLTIQWAEP